MQDTVASLLGEIKDDLKTFKQLLAETATELKSLQRTHVHVSEEAIRHRDPDEVNRIEQENQSQL